MAKLENVKNGEQCLLIKDYIDIYHEGKLSIPAVSYAIRNDKIDYIQPSRDRYIELTKKTLDYKPRLDKVRT